MPKIDTEFYGVVLGLEEAATRRSDGNLRFDDIALQAIRNIQERVESLGVVSPSSLKETVDALLSIHGDLGDGFAVDNYLLVTADDYRHGGADPERYFLVADRLRLAPEDIAVLASDVQNVEAADRAGCYVVGLTFDHQFGELQKAGAHEAARNYPHAATILMSHLRKRPNIPKLT